MVCYTGRQLGNKTNNLANKNINEGNKMDYEEMPFEISDGKIPDTYDGPGSVGVWGSHEEEAGELMEKKPRKSDNEWKEELDREQRKPRNEMDELSERIAAFKQKHNGDMGRLAMRHAA